MGIVLDSKQKGLREIQHVVARSPLRSSSGINEMTNEENSKNNKGLIALIYVIMNGGHINMGAQFFVGNRTCFG